MTKIYIDPGHGGIDSGASGNGLLEKNLTLQIALKIRDILANEYENVTVRMSRTSDKTLSLDERTNDANAWRADFLLSVHINSGGGIGYEDYVYSGPKQASTKHYQNIIHEEVTKQIDFIDRGKKQANFHMLRESNMPALLSENGFIDNESDARKLKQSSFIEKLARGHANGLAKIFSLKKKANRQKELNKNKTAKETSELYRVQIGAFKNKENAEELAEKAKAKGFDIYVKNDGLYKVLIGTFSSQKNAEDLAEKARSAGFDVIIDTDSK